jgi:hypothetical protein
MSLEVGECGKVLSICSRYDGPLMQLAVRFQRPLTWPLSRPNVLGWLVDEKACSRFC